MLTVAEVVPASTNRRRDTVYSPWSSSWNPCESILKGLANVPTFSVATVGDAELIFEVESLAADLRADDGVVPIVS